MDKYEVAQVLRDVASLVELVDENPKKSIAYRRAANAIEILDNFNELLENNLLESIPGIGKKISQMIISLITDNQLSYHTFLKECVPATVLDLANVPGLNLNKVRTLYKDFKITSLTDLKNALEQKNLKGAKGFGPSFLAKLEKKLSEQFDEGNSLLYSKANHIAEMLLAKLSPVTTKIEISGALRRKLEIIHEINFLATTDEQEACRDLFLNHGFVQQVITAHSSFIKVVLKQGIFATLQIVEESDFPISFLTSTGNERHLKDLEMEASKKGLLLYSDLSRCQEESKIYEILDLNFIPPELREGYGEVEASKKTNFSDFIKENDLKGTFHCHTIDSDGVHTIEEMANAAIEMGWEYIGITDHSKSSYQANGLSEERLLAQISWIRDFNKTLGPHFKIFSGVECDILKDGQLDFGKDILKELDFVIVSMHSLFKLEKDLMTERMIKAIENPYTTIIGHLTGRLLRSRDPYALDISKVIDACIANDKIIELNCYPNRLDMDWRYWIQAKERGLKCSINPDAHSTDGLRNCIYGVDIARKGWLKKNDVINTFPLKEMIKFLKKRKP
ncbi:MAG: PHP domain-containing protein [Parachlamydiaceae bacterium]|nr:PHP domain-containing protein [Parachlamydiaceae bacterium]